jgi:segregation and condensation protein A
MLKDFDIDLAGDFLVMAATLMHIKSAMLLPKDVAEEISEDGELIDPRSELIGQLLEYKKFKDAANLLESAAESKEDRFSRPSTIIDGLKGESEPELDIDQVNIWDLLEAFDRVMKATGSYFDISHIKDDTPIDLYQIDILNNLQLRGPMSFGSIFEGVRSKVRMVGLFLALLELSRGKLIWIEQDESSKAFIIKALTDEPAEEAVQRAILVTEEEELLWMQEQMEKQELGGAVVSEVEERQEDLEDVELEEDADFVKPMVEMEVESGFELENEELVESVAGAGIPIVELPAEKKKRPIFVKNEEMQEVSQAGPVPIVELPAGLNAVEKQRRDSEEKLAEDYSN